MKYIGLSLAVVAIALVGYFIYLDSFVQSTRQIVRKVAHNRVLEGLAEECMLSQVDAWGRQLKYKRTGNTLQIIHVVISAGSDGKFDTADDIVGQDVDTNFSRIAGAVIADQATEFGKGVKDGLTHKNQFEKNEPPKRSMWQRLKEKAGFHSP